MYTVKPQTDAGCSSHKRTLGAATLQRKLNRPPGLRMTATTSYHNAQLPIDAALLEVCAYVAGSRSVITLCEFQLMMDLWPALKALHLFIKLA